jgi:hypothetical protein
LVLTHFMGNIRSDGSAFICTCKNKECTDFFLTGLLCMRNRRAEVEMRWFCSIGDQEESSLFITD